RAEFLPGSGTIRQWGDAEVVEGLLTAVTPGMISGAPTRSSTTRSCFTACGRSRGRTLPRRDGGGSPGAAGPDRNALRDGRMRGAAVLVLTGTDDTHADDVILKLHDRNVPVVRFDTGEFPEECRLFSQVA